MPPLPSPIAHTYRRDGDVLLLGEHLGGRLGGVARVHRLLERRHTPAIDIADYLRDVAEDAIAAAHAGALTQLLFIGGKGRVGNETALSLGFIVRELTANSLTFAHPARVRGIIGLSCHVRAGALTLELFDDGVGLPEDFDPARDGRAGFRLVRNLARQIGAVLSFDSDALGFSFRLRLRAP